MITATLAVFSIAATVVMFEDLYAQFNSSWPEDGHARHMLMAGIVMCGIWFASAAIATLITSFT